jgi:hypothetical protein
VTESQLAALDTTAPAYGGNADLLDALPLIAGIIDQIPARLQTAHYQAFDIQCLYRKDKNQVSIYATITTSTSRAVAAIIADAGNDPASITTPSQPPPQTTRAFTLQRNALYDTKSPRSREWIDGTPGKDAIGRPVATPRRPRSGRRRACAAWLRWRTRTGRSRPGRAATGRWCPRPGWCGQDWQIQSPPDGPGRQSC